MVLVLLIIFMVTAPVLQSGIEVAVPHTKTVKEITEERLVITINRDQKVFLNSQPVNINQIGAMHSPEDSRSAKVSRFTSAPMRTFPSAPLPLSWMPSSSPASPT